MEMMDIDTDSNLNFNHSSISIGADADADSQVYACAMCGRHVCDTCAVRGDVRSCLECANPGNGNAHTSASYNIVGAGGGVNVSCGMEAGSIYNGYRGAVQGGGAGGAMVLAEKRWIGGIGWM